jgi:acyl-homoserine lactone acylase PvdQ
VGGDAGRTTAGKTLLLANLHLPCASMLTYYEAHLTAPGYSVYGGIAGRLPVVRLPSTTIRLPPTPSTPFSASRATN